MDTDTSFEADWHPAVNFEPRRGGLRPSILLMHYTGMASAERAIGWLCSAESRVSCHYLVSETGRIVQMVREEMRAWHAGESFWAGETDINSASIGIEVHNPGHGSFYPPFPEPQMQAVEALSLDILARHDIRPERVLAHSDVAPARKEDPGEKFPWARLAEAGVAVGCGVLRREAEDLNAGYLMRIRTGRPLVCLKTATTLDGRIAARTGESRWITGPEARDRVHLMRARYDAVMVGVGTAAADDPELTCRLPGRWPRQPVRHGANSTRPDCHRPGSRGSRVRT